MDKSELHLDRTFQAKLREVYLDRDVKCPRCRYHLRGVPGPRCPECGLVITEFLRVADTTGWRLQKARVKWLIRRLIVWVLLLVIGVCVIVGALLWR